eukprot:13162268-Alexandrium_andersonii.AAC.1
MCIRDRHRAYRSQPRPSPAASSAATAITWPATTACPNLTAPNNFCHASVVCGLWRVGKSGTR